jgi:hypothetical protein
MRRPLNFAITVAFFLTLSIGYEIVKTPLMQHGWWSVILFETIFGDWTNMH